MTDLHLHTTCSDGQYTPSEVVALAKAAGITTLAITDHDTVDGVTEGAAAAEAAGLRFIPGIEISVKGTRELHILGYFIDPTHPSLVRMCAEFTRFRREREARIFAYLEARGVHLTADQVRKHVAHSRVGRPHFARAMVDAGYVATTREAFDRYLGTPEFDRVERPKPSPEGGIRVIREAGGIAVLAHPGKLKFSMDLTDILVRDLVEVGLSGIECYYSTHTAAETAAFLALADKYRLCVTGGSDFHGEAVKPDIRLGKLEVACSPRFLLALSGN